MSNEHIEYFKRFAASYMRWTHFNFDRIVADAVRRQEQIRLAKIEAEKKEAFDKSIMGQIFKLSKETANKYAEDIMKDHNFMSGTQWPKDAKIGSTLRIKI